MKKRDDILSVVAAALIIYSAFISFSAQKKLAAASAFRAELQLRLDEVSAEAAQLRALLDAPPSPEVMERLAREKLGLILPGEVIYYFTDRED